MSKTEVILTHNVIGLGAESDQVKVAAGYARNYLLPQGLAIPLTAANQRRLEALRQRRAEREAHEFNIMSELAKGLSQMVLLLTAKTGEGGKMFGAITPGSIADELKHQFDVAVDKKKIHLEHPLRTLGEHEVELRLHPEVTATLKVRINTATPLPQPLEAPATEPRTKESAPRKAKEIASTKDREPASAKAREAAPARTKEAVAKSKEAVPAKGETRKERAPRKPTAEKKAE
ncbi:MAG: 50S ribosomal protein L9 [Verrucomicrobia bacterium]|nr:MAG: 50S ribosomal protein L9 [Verrucomicrobiota bacterium]